jgi:REP element-mobilizing transposase RayT
MANTYHQVYIQVVFAVKYREVVIANEWKSIVFGIIGNLINETGCKTIIVNGVEDHVHCFLGLKPSVSISELMKTVKAKSSKYINDNQLTKSRFEWQEGYGAFSYGHSQINSVYKYVANQEEHHKKQTFKEEYLTFLDKFEIPFEERYVFEDLI